MTFSKTTDIIANMTNQPSFPKPLSRPFEKDNPHNPLGKPFVRYISLWDLFKTQTKTEEFINKVKCGPLGYTSNVSESIARIMEDFFPFAIDSVKIAFTKNDGERELLSMISKKKVLDKVRDEVALLCNLVDNGSFDECFDKTLATPKATICLAIDVVHSSYETTSEFFNKEEEFFLENILNEIANLKIHSSVVVVFPVNGSDIPRPLTKEEYERIVQPHKTKT